jgi:hypothetical protein
MSGRSGFSIGIGVVDSASAKIDALNKRIAALNAPADRFNRSMAKFGEVSGINRVSEGVKGLGDRGLETARSLERMVSPFGLLTSGASIAGIAEMSRRWAEAGNQIGKVSYMLDTPVEKISSLRGAARLAGSSVEALDTSMEGLNKNLRDIAHGRATGETVGIFKQMGVDAGTSGHVTTAADALGQIADFVKTLKDPGSQRHALEIANISPDLLPLLKNGRQGLADFERQAQAAGVKTTEMARAGAELNTAFERMGLDIDGIVDRLETKYAPKIKTILGATSDWIEKNKALADTMAEVGTAVGTLAALPALATLLGKLGYGAVVPSAPVAAVAAAGTGLVIAGGLAGYMEAPMVDEYGRVIGNWGGRDERGNPAWGGLNDTPTGSPWWQRFLPGSLRGRGGAAGPGPRADRQPVGPSAVGAIDEGTFGRAKQFRDAFVKKGATSDEAWGLAGNAVAESVARWDSQPGDMGAAHGAFMWRNSGNDKRLDRIVDRLGGRLPENTSFQETVDAAWDELHGPERAAWDRIHAAVGGPGGKGGAVSRFWERPGVGEAKQAEEEAHRAGFAERLAAMDARRSGGPRRMLTPAEVGGLPAGPVPPLRSEAPPAPAGDERGFAPLNDVPGAPTVKGGVHVTVELKGAPAGTTAAATAHGHATTAPPRIETSLPGL